MDKRRLARIVRQVKKQLTSDLLLPKFRDDKHPLAGHCYVASEAIYHLLGGADFGIKPMFVRHEGQPHWFLTDAAGNVIDATCEQFTKPVPYHLAVGKGFLTKGPSKRAQAVMTQLEEI